MDGGAVILMFLPVALVITTIAGGLAWLLRRSQFRQFRRIQAMVPGAYVFTFSSNRWYQEALLELQRQEIIDPKALTEDANPVSKGPRWIAASSAGIRIMRGYDATPVVGFEWSKIGRISSEMHVGHQRSGPYPGVTIPVLGPDGDIRLVLYTPSAAGSILSSLKQARAVEAELNRVRDAPPTATVI